VIRFVSLVSTVFFIEKQSVKKI